MQQYVPEDLLIGNLLKLPAIALLRSKCVCKSWCPLINNSSFVAKPYLINNQNTNFHYVLLALSHQTILLAYLLTILSRLSIPNPRVPTITWETFTSVVHATVSHLFVIGRLMEPCNCQIGRQRFSQLANTLSEVIIIQWLDLDLMPQTWITMWS